MSWTPIVNLRANDKAFDHLISLKEIIKEGKLNLYAEDDIPVEFLSRIKS